MLNGALKLLLEWLLLFERHCTRSGFERTYAVLVGGDGRAVLRYLGGGQVCPIYGGRGGCPVILGWRLGLNAAVTLNDDASPHPSPSTPPLPRLTPP